MFLALTVFATPTFDPNDLSYLVFKHPNRVQTFELTFGTATVAFPVVTTESCTFTLTVEANPVTLVRDSKILEEYVNDRPYVAGSLLCAALRKVIGSALSGKLPGDKPHLAMERLPFEIVLPTVSCHAGEELIKKLFEPLGYTVATEQLALDTEFSSWGMSRFFTVKLTGTAVLSEVLRHLYILLPVLDNDKHYAVDPAEVKKLTSRGEGWLEKHPLRELIVKRYLCYAEALVQTATEQLDQALSETEEPNESSAAASVKETETARMDPERKIKLHAKRHQVVIGALKSHGVKTVADVGCGSGQLIEELVRDEAFERIIGFEPNQYQRTRAKRRLKCGRRGGPPSERLKIIPGSATLPDSLLKSVDAAVLVEVIEHLELWQLPGVERAIFAFARPALIIVTTPNQEYNVLLEGLEQGKMRDHDHKFEWTRSEFETWAQGVAERSGYVVTFEGIGTGAAHETHGLPSQMAIFTRSSEVLPPALDYVGELTADELFAPKREIATQFGTIIVNGTATAAAFDIWARSGIDPRWLAYIPPTMSPVETHISGPYLEHPDEAFAYYKKHGVQTVICEEKHMGSRGPIMVCRDAAVAQERFGITTGDQGFICSRMGLPFFAKELEQECLSELATVCTAANLWEELGSNWVLIDTEIMPWSAKAQGLLVRQYAPAAAAGVAALTMALEYAQITLKRILSEEEMAHALKLRDTLIERLACVQAFRVAYRRYCWPTEGLAGIKIAPFHILASEGAVHTDKPHTWHMDMARRLADASTGLVISTVHRVVDLSDESQVRLATQWWEELVAEGGEGMVVKPLDFITRDANKELRILQPAVKVRGPEYLRIIYGPEYPRLLERLRTRAVRAKRELAMHEFLIGIEGLKRLVERRDENYLADCVLGVLAFESGSGDPRL